MRISSYYTIMYIPPSIIYLYQCIDIPSERWMSYYILYRYTFPKKRIFYYNLGSMGKLLNTVK